MKVKDNKMLFNSRNRFKFPPLIFNNVSGIQTGCQNVKTFCSISVIDAYIIYIIYFVKTVFTVQYLNFTIF